MRVLRSSQDYICLLCVLLVLLTVSCPARGAQHPYLRPDLGAHARAVDASTDPAEKTPTTPRLSLSDRDRDLLPYYVAATVTATADVATTVRGRLTGRIEETNPALLALARVGGNTGLAVGVAAASVGYVLLVRAKVYPAHPRLAKVYLTLFSVLHGVLAARNRHNLEFVRRLEVRP